MPETFRIALLPGDGIGPDVVVEAVKVLRAVAPDRLEYEELSVGANEFLRSGDPLPAATFERLKDFDAILLGAMGLPDVRWPDGTEMTPQIDLREKLDLYCGLAADPAVPRVALPTEEVGAGEIDFLIIRENTEGLFFSRLDKPRPWTLPRCATPCACPGTGRSALFHSAFTGPEAPQACDAG
jgi:3-isopropylmalate dehydrogenase